MNISILGCGRLGLPLAKALVKKDHIVKGSTAGRPKLALIQESGVEAYFVSLLPELSDANLSKFFRSEMIIINFPPKRIENIVDYHTRQIKSLIGQIEKSEIKKVIFVSSTSVYPNLNCEVRENDAANPEKESGKALLIAEKLLIENTHFETTVIRFGGLIGNDRNPVNFLTKIKDRPFLNNPVNLIHVKDCIQVIIRLIEGGEWGEIYNACCPEHPLRNEFYSVVAKLAGIEHSFPDIPMSSRYKIINSDKLIKDLNYKFIYSNPLQIFSGSG